jgi:hypothetical protein
MSPDTAVNRDFVAGQGLGHARRVADGDLVKGAVLESGVCLGHRRSSRAAAAKVTN